MTPFDVNWSAAEVGAVLARVRAYRFPPVPEGEGWRYGCDATFLRDFCRYWTERYDWRAAVERLNRFPQFTAEVDGVDLHFVHDAWLARLAHRSARISATCSSGSRPAARRRGTTWSYPATAGPKHPIHERWSRPAVPMPQNRRCDGLHS